VKNPDDELSPPDSQRQMSKTRIGKKKKLKEGRPWQYKEKNGVCPIGGPYDCRTVVPFR